MAAQSDDGEFRVLSEGLREFTKKSIADREYTLLQRFCTNCEEWHYEIARFSGASFSLYKMEESFQPHHFETFIENIDDMLLETAADLIQHFYRSITDKNSQTGIEADGSFAFRLLEYGRHRASRLQKLDMLDAIISSEPPRNKQEEAVRAAFELGMATAEHRLMDRWEDYLMDGMAMSEWRESGLPKARAERLRLGKNSRSAIVKAALKLYKSDPLLIRNDSEVARRIIALNLPALQKGGGASLGIDAITKHLRAARHAKEI